MEVKTKLEIGEDEEEFQRLTHCVELLVAAGYFRARVKGLSAFDKIVGGIVWCISTCNYTVDVDLLYAENSTIGQKIALTERICEVLMQLQCPYPLEPHQIQGLDILNIYPVIQWLVKKAIEAKELFGDRNKNFVSYLADPNFREKAVKPELRFSDSNFQLNENLAKNFPSISSQKELLKAVRKIGKREETPEKEEFLLLEEAIRRSKLPEFEKTIKIDTFEFEEKESTSQHREETEEDLDRLIEELNSELRDLGDECQVEEINLQTLEAECLLLDEKLNYAGKLEKNLDEELLSDLREKFGFYMQISTREAEFKRQCEREIDKIMGEILRFEENAERAEDINRKEWEDRLLIEEEKLKRVREMGATWAREIAGLQRSIDSVPSQIEIAQYHKRLIELYNQMGSKHRQTRQYYVYHNYLIDLRNYMKKEAELLNSIEEAVPLAKTEANRDSFINQLTRILRGVETNLEKHQQQEKELDGKKEILSVEIGFQREKERAFQKALDDFKKACEAIEKYQQLLRVDAINK
ncbi:unnamed protein product, partial [Mesorhabditis belari]|uniref:Coiled-coil domain-containing protein 93 n=1 Tax=Mesorhabditis belari TaxID=2138241 RepID=A0AAF3EUI9_9BILA